MQPFFFIRTDNQCVKINFRDIVYVEANRNYIRIVTEAKTYMVLISMKQMETILPHQHFCRVHRSYIVSLDRVHSFDMETLTYIIHNKKESLPLGLQYRKLLFDKVMILASEVRQGMRLSGMHVESLLNEE